MLHLHRAPRASPSNRSLAGRGLSFHVMATSSSSLVLDPSTLFLLTTKGRSSSMILASKASPNAHKVEGHIGTAPFGGRTEGPVHNALGALNTGSHVSRSRISHVFHEDFLD